jgi:hypothetical protein
VSFDLYVWHEAAPVTAGQAAAMVGRWAAGERGIAGAHPAVVLLRAELRARFSSESATVAGDGSDGSDGGGEVLVVSAAAPHAVEVASAVRDGAKRHGLVCYDPQDRVVEPNAPGHLAAFTLSSARLAPVTDPDAALLERTVRHLSADNFFVVLERADGWFVQVGFGPAAGAGPGTYALEYQQGGAERHFRCDTTDLEEAVRLLREFQAGDDSWQRRHEWRPLEL